MEPQSGVAQQSAAAGQKNKVSYHTRSGCQGILISLTC